MSYMKKHTHLSDLEKSLAHSLTETCDRSIARGKAIAQAVKAIDNGDIVGARAILWAMM
jgi:hypothetical protein